MNTQDSEQIIAEHDPALYRPERSAQVVPGPSSIDSAAVTFYREHGYMAVAGVLNEAEVAESIAHVEWLARHADTDGDYARTQREATAKNEAGSDAVRKLWFDRGQVEQSGMPVHHPTVLDIVSRLMNGQGPVIFQTMALLKPPRIGREKPWHQDHAYFDIPLEDRIVGVWIALDEATIDNGCMQLIDAGHLDGPMHHWKRRDWQICDTDMMGRQSVAAQLKPGAALFFDSLLPHGTPSNRSSKRRRAMQFHYAPANAASWTTEQRMEVFGTEGKDVYC